MGPSYQRSRKQQINAENQIVFGVFLEPCGLRKKIIARERKPKFLFYFKPSVGT